MQSGSAKRPVSKAYYQELLDELERTQHQYDLALEEASETMRGWSDLAAKASYASSMQALARGLQQAKAKLDAVTPVDHQPGIAENASGQSIDEIIANASSEADFFWLELRRNGSFVDRIPDSNGPLDPRAEADRLIALGETGELRLMRGATPDDQCVAIYLIRRKP